MFTRLFIAPAVVMLRVRIVQHIVERELDALSQRLDENPPSVYVRGPQRYYDDPDYLTRSFRPE